MLRLIALLVLAAACVASLAQQLTTADDAAQWTRNFNADGTPKPLHDPAGPALWPNRKSHANSDEWISKNHDIIRQMRPRMLFINFSNQVDPRRPLQLAADLINALGESSRYHGYENPNAPAFLEYSVWRYVDMRDPGVKTGNTIRAPRKANAGEKDMNCDYGGFFSEKFAEAIGVRDPKNKKRFLRLDELVDQGYVHEVTFVCAPTPDFRCLECIEEKPQYDEQFHKVPGKWVQAGNGGDDAQKWTGRSLRINCLNETRGIGCGTENLGHCLEGMAHCGCIPYYKKYFYEYGMFDLDKKYGLPFNSYYELWGEGKGVTYPDEHTAIVNNSKQTWTLKDYVAIGGNVHFPPNGRHHYDQENTSPVMSTIEHWRRHDGPDGKDIAAPWTNAVLKQFEKVAGDCMGKWLVYWRQNMPGLNNLSKDDDGKPMKNWWPFLFY